MNNETVLEMINKRIDELSSDYNKLAAAFSVLNESHHTLELKFTEMATEWKTTKSLIKWILGTSVLGFIGSLLTILRLFGVV